MGRAIEADIKDSDEETLTIMVGLQHESVGPHTDNLGRRTKTTTWDLNDYTAPTAAVTGSVVAPFLLHSTPPLATLPAIPLTDTTLECGFTTGDSNWDEVVLSFTHTPATVNGWELVGYYRQLFYPPDYDVDTGRLFRYTPIGAEDFETGASFQHYYAQAQVYNAQAEVVAVYEKDGRRLGARRTIGCTGVPDTRAPVLLSALVNGPVLTLTYDEELDDAHVPDKSDFTVTGQSRTVQSVAVVDQGRTVTLTLGPPVTEDETVTLTYALPTDTAKRIQDDYGNQAAAFTDQPVTNLTNESPVLVTAVVDGAELTLTYNEPLDTTSEPLGTAYTVSGGHTVTSVDVAGSTVTLALSTAVGYQETVTLDYDAPSSNPVQDSEGNDAADLNGQPVANNTSNPDNSPPLLQNLVVYDAMLTLTYNEALDTASNPAGSAYTVSGTGRMVTTVVVAGSTVTLTLSTAAAYEETVTLSYAAQGTDPVQDPAGNDAADFSGRFVRNDTPNPDQTLPLLDSAVVDGAELTLTYNEPLDTTSKPLGTAYTVWVTDPNTSGFRNPHSVSVNGKVVTLTFDMPVEHGDIVTVNYLVPGTNPIQDEAGNDAADLEDMTVRNDTPDTDPPMLDSAVVNGATLTLTYDEPLDGNSAPAGDTYTVIVAGGVYRPSSVSVSGDEVVTLTLPTPAEHGDIVTVSYLVPGTNPIQDEAGNDAADLEDVSVTNETPDTDPPVFDNALVNGAMLTLTYDEELNGDSAPVVGAFTVTVDGMAATVTLVEVSGATVTLTLSPAAAWRETVTVSYTKPQTGAAIEDLAGNDAANLTNKDVENVTQNPDQTAPVLQTREVDGAALTLTYNEDLDSTSAPAGSAYTVMVNSVARTVDDNITVTSRVVSLTLSTAVVHGDVVTVAYDAPSSNPVRDLAENNAANFSAQGVTNNTPFVDTTPPQLVGASVNRATMILTYDEALNGSSRPATSAYTVKVDGVSREVTTVSVSGVSVRLVLATAVERVDDVTVSYTKPQTGPVIQDDADSPNAAASFTDYDVTNNTPWDTIPPRLVTAFVNGDTLTLTYNDALRNSVPATSAYTVDVNGVDTTHTVSSVRVSAVSVVLTLSSAVDFGDVVTLDYDAPASSPIIDLARNPAGDLTNQPVTNNTQPLSAHATEDTRNDRQTHEDALMEQGYWPEDINGEVIPDTRTRIYLQLARELKADETPDIAIFGGVVLDLAGNSNVTEEITPRDGIAPRFTVTVTATAQDRPVANARGEYVVDVRADEDLRRRPVVYFTGIGAVETVKDNEGTGEYLYSIGDDVQTGSSLAEQEDDDHWAGTYSTSGLTGLGELFGLVVYGFDHEDNIGESGGWTPSRHRRTPDVGPPVSNDDLELEKMDEAGVLLEIDREFNGDATPEFAVTPSRRQRDDETESSNPFISIKFMEEADEYAVCPTAGCGEENDNPDAKFEDSHARVDITAITLNGRAAMSMLSRVDAGQFALITSGLELGKHEVEYMAVDDAGNVATFEFAFSVVERTPYELTVSPGWNLISFPGTPSDPSVGGVIPSGGRVSPVLAYQNGDWLTAVESDDGEWAGNLSQFEAGFGYWLFTTTFTPLEPLIEEPDQTSVLPSVRVDHGWNLLGVIDIFQNDAGTPPGAEGSDGEADDYFGSIPWRIAYTYDTLHSRWMKAVPDADRLAPEGTTADERGFRLVDGKVVTQEILNGKGYWVWSAEPGTLVP